MLSLYLCCMFVDTWESFVCVVVTPFISITALDIVKFSEVPVGRIEFEVFPGTRSPSVEAIM